MAITTGKRPFAKKVYERGFTLIEIVVVVVIIGILMSLVLVIVPWATQTANIDKTQVLIARLESGIRQYAAEFKQFPPSDGSYTSLQLPYYLGKQFTISDWYGGSTPAPTRTVGPFVQFTPSDVATNVPGAVLNFTTLSSIDSRFFIPDAWNKMIRYRNPGTHNTSFVDIWSYGPDGVQGTSDDIQNWR